MLIAIITTVGTLLGTILGSYITTQANIKANKHTHSEERKKRYETFIRKTLIDYLPVMKNIYSRLERLILVPPKEEYKDESFTVTHLLQDLDKVIKFYNNEIVENAPNDLIGEFSNLEESNSSFYFYIEINVNDLYKNKNEYLGMLNDSKKTLAEIEKKISEKYI